METSKFTELRAKIKIKQDDENETARLDQTGYTKVTPGHDGFELCNIHRRKLGADKPNAAMSATAGESGRYATNQDLSASRKRNPFNNAL